uniref:THAP-type domain-containing protein n=1 Tax=Salarias fasciatus TaxID=181472 RepID=A0A672IKK3_SALFA
MPHHCSAWGCTNRQNKDCKLRGITFHRFPTNKFVRKQWEAALRREAFIATSYSRLCSEHFEEKDFDRTGQTVRIRDGVLPSVFNFPAHLKRKLSSKGDHSYALPTCPGALKARLSKAMAKVESLEREKRNARDRERRAKSTVCGLLEELRAKNLINEELKEKLDLYSERSRRRIPLNMDVCVSCWTPCL